MGIDLNGKVVAVIGGGGILGNRICRALMEAGAHVAAIDRDGAKLDQMAADIGREEQLLPLEVDITKSAALAAAKAAIEQRFGPVDCLHNNAAIKSAHFFEPFETFPLDDWNEVMEVNTTSVMTACQIFGGAMARRGQGSIVNTLSVYGLVGPDQRIYEGSEYEGRAINTPAVYSTSKAAVWGLTKYLAAYWGDKNVRVNAVTPGGVFSGQNDEFVRRYSARVPLGRMAQLDEISGAVIYLASDASSYVTGQNIVVDGGLTSW